jgi:hypothetical protein
MPFNLLLFPLLGGFIFLSYWNRSENFAKRLDKERLLLWSAFVGAVLLGCSVGAFLLTPFAPAWLGVSSLQKWWAYHVPFQYSGFALCAGLLGPMGAWVLNHVPPFSWIWNAESESERAILEYGGPLEQLLYRALDEEKHVMVTLTNGKVYIGRVAISLAPENDTAFYLLPTKSGYRESDKHRLEITTHYDEVYKKIIEGETDAFDIISDFGVVIPVKEVISASLYREEIHNKYFAHEQDAPSLPASSNPDQLTP